MEQLRFKVHNQKSKIEGIGAFAGETIDAHKKIGNLGGTIISQRAGRKKSSLYGKSDYGGVGNRKSLDAAVDANALRYINHSCGPNAYMRVRYPRVEFYALRQISKWEEITCNYGLTHHDGKLPCRCGSPACKGFL